MYKILILFFSLILLVNSSEARIRLRKVKDSPKVCALMKVDSLLSRPAKPIWSTERHSVVVADDVTLVNDLGQKICSWNKSSFTSLGEVSEFHFYIDEFKEVLYPYLELPEKGGYLLFKVPLKSCSLEDQSPTKDLDFPKCEKPKKSTKKKKKK